MARSLDGGGKFLCDAKQNVEKEFCFLGRCDMQMHDQQIINDMAVRWRDRDQKAVRHDNRKGLSIEPRLPISGVAGKEDDRVAVPFDPGYFVLIEAVSQIGNIKRCQLGNPGDVIEGRFPCIDPAACPRLVYAFEFRVADRFKIDFEHNHTYRTDRDFLKRSASAPFQKGQVFPILHSEGVGF